MGKDGSQVRKAMLVLRQRFVWSGWGRLTCVVLLAYAMIPGIAIAAPAAPPRKSTAGQVKPTPPNAADATAPRKGGCDDKASTDGRSRLDMSTNHGPKDAPRWNCAEPEVTVPPVWHGDRIECNFTIKNDGTGPLNIKARGG